MADLSSPPAQGRPDAQTRGKRILLLLAAVCIAPVLGVLRGLLPVPARRARELRNAPPHGARTGDRRRQGRRRRFRLSDLRGRWVLLVADAGRCDAACERMLYATRQARTMQGKEQDRIVRVRLAAGDGSPDEEILAQHPGLVVVRASAGALASLSAARRAIFIVDPLGNLVLRIRTIRTSRDSRTISPGCSGPRASAERCPARWPAACRSRC